MVNSNQQPIRSLVNTIGALGLGAVGLTVSAIAYGLAQLNMRTPNVFLESNIFSPYEVQVNTYEEVAFQTSDGLTLRGWWLEQPTTNKTILVLNGHRSRRTQFLGIGGGLWHAGYNVLLFDYRSRGDSQVAQHSLAYYEMRDAQAAVQYIYQRLPEAELGVIGYSMGAALALLVAAETPTIKVVVADSPFASVSAVVAHGARQLRIPPGVALPLLDRANQWIYGYRFDDVRPIDAVPALAARPLLLIHGECDGLIPLAHTTDLFAAAGEPKELWIEPNVDHCGAYFVDRRAYVARVATFFEKHFYAL
jgi:fermentation-respiration switch protein FrsA (DUF1100 family)